MIWQDSIVINPNKMVGKTVAKRPRVAPEFVIELMSQGWSEEYILFNYPQISKDDIQACLNYDNKVVQSENNIPDSTKKHANSGR